MKITSIRILFNVLASLVAIAFVFISYLQKAHADLLFSVEIILLPSIYIIGNLAAENKIKEEYDEATELLNRQIEELNEKYYNEKIINIQLYRELSHLRGKND